MRLEQWQQSNATMMAMMRQQRHGDKQTTNQPTSGTAWLVLTERAAWLLCVMQTRGVDGYSSWKQCALAAAPLVQLVFRFLQALRSAR